MYQGLWDSSGRTDHYFSKFYGFSLCDVSYCRGFLGACLLGLMWCSSSFGNTHGLDWNEVELNIDSGPIYPTTTSSGDQASLGFATLLGSFDAEWLRFNFGDVELASGNQNKSGAYIRLTSLQDGGVQILDAQSLEQWNNTSAYFNGPLVLLEVLQHSSNGKSRIQISSMQEGKAVPAQNALCTEGERHVYKGDRTPDALFLPSGCTSFLIGERCLLTASHCGVEAGDVIGFNVPLAGRDGSPNLPQPEDQYPVDPLSVQIYSDGFDWAYFGVFDNSNTKLSPLEAQKSHYKLAESFSYGHEARPLRIRGYGVAFESEPAYWNKTLKVAEADFHESTPNGYFTHNVPVSGGESGAAVVDLITNRVIGIQSMGVPGDAPCGAAVSISTPGLQEALANPKGVCANPMQSTR